MPEHPMQRRSRWRSTASTWLAKTTALLTHDAQEAKSDAERWVIGYDAARLLGDVLDAADSLIPLLNDEEYQVEQLRKDAQAVAKGLRARVLVPKLAHTTGRTPEEAAAFRAKAESL